jgi:hypothetical protein
LTLVAWWQGIPGLDGNCIPHDPVFANRCASLGLAIRLHDADPTTVTASQRDSVLKTASVLFVWLHGTENTEKLIARREGAKWVAGLAPAGLLSEISVKTFQSKADRLAAYLLKQAPGNTARRRDDERIIV